MSKLKPNQLDNYEVEIVEDIPEQFDLSRYKKSKMQNTQQYRAAPPPPPPLQSQSSQQQLFVQQQMTGYMTQPQQQNYYQAANPQQQNMFENVYIVNQQNRDYLIEQKNLKPNGSQIVNNNLEYSQQVKAASSASMVTAPLSKTSNPQDIMNSQMSQQFVQYAVNYQGAIKPNYRYPNQQVVQMAPTGQSPPQQGTTIQRHPQHPSYMNQGALDNIPQQSKNVQVNYYPSKDYDYQYPPHSTTLKKKSTTSSTGTKYADMDHQIIDHEYQPQRTLLHDNSGTNWNNKPSKSEGRKKNSFDDEDDDNPHQKREYYLKGGDEARDELKRPNNRDNYMDDVRADPSPHRSSNTIDTAIVVPTKSSLKPPKKQGVTFDEKLEVYEVKNPHYGLEAKSEKREIRKKKKDKQKEEELILKTKLDMKLKIQNQNMLHYYVLIFLFFFY